MPYLKRKILTCNAYIKVFKSASYPCKATEQTRRFETLTLKQLIQGRCLVHGYRTGTNKYTNPCRMLRPIQTNFQPTLPDGRGLNKYRSTLCTCKTQPGGGTRYKAASLVNDLFTPFFTLVQTERGDFFIEGVARGQRVSLSPTNVLQMAGDCVRYR